MEEHFVKLLSRTPVTHDTNLYKVEKPANYVFVPGQATEIAIQLKGWNHENRPFTFTGLNEWDHLEFIIKSYTDHEGVTNQLSKLNEGDELILHDVWGAIHYQGPGVFIAGGAGITPFIAIFRDLVSKNLITGNSLIFANKTEQDIILKDELKKWLGDHFINILSEEHHEKYAHGHLSKEFLQATITDFTQKFYICGPPKMIEVVQHILQELGAKENAIVIEL